MMVKCKWLKHHKFTRMLTRLAYLSGSQTSSVMPRFGGRKLSMPPIKTATKWFLTFNLTFFKY